MFETSLTEFKTDKVKKEAGRAALEKLRGCICVNRI
jgi:hypothetical protein